MSFVDELNKETNTAFTANGAVSNQSSLSPLVDFFAKGAAQRPNPDAALELFNKAYAEDPLRAVKILFWVRDIRGGSGERKIFRHIFNSLDLSIKKQLVKFVGEYGRWDDLLEDVDSSLELVRYQLREDKKALAEGKNISLLAKWMPSGNTGKRAKVAAEKWAKALNMTDRQYRRLLVELRKKLDTLEDKMSNGRWEDIQFDKLPSQAFRKYTEAFKRHLPDQFAEFMKKAEKGEVKVNASTLFAYEVYNMVKAGKATEANVLWDNLPDYTRGENALVIADVSGSMTGGNPSPMSISVSLALYFADRNRGAFKDYFMTFSERPKLQRVRGTTLRQKMDSIEDADWGMSTNLEAAFKAILAAAQKSNATPEEIPSTLYVISDMQFNECVNDRTATNYQNVKSLFEAAGYKLPHVVFWNCSAWGGDSPATIFDENTTLISGSSQSNFQHAVQGKTPVESMLEVIDGERYAPIAFEV